MSWVEAQEYKALIGGCYFVSIPRIIDYNGNPFISIKRNTADEQIGVDVDVTDSNGTLVSEIRDGEILLCKQDEYHVLRYKMRSTIVEIKTGRILYDFIKYPKNNKGLDFQMSLLTYLPNRLPIFLHPNRIRIGSPRIAKPHLTSLKLATQKGVHGPALKIELSNSDNREDILHLPSVPMVGQGGVVALSLVENSGQEKHKIGILMMQGENNQASNLSFRGPCYFLDIAIENFETGMAIFCGNHK